MIEQAAHPWSYAELFTRSLRDERRRSLHETVSVKTLAELRLCEKVHQT